jgi:hypothetical protein
MRALSEDPRLLELGGREVIRVDCQCGRVVQLAPFQLIEQLGVDRGTRVSELKPHLKCKTCKKRPKLVSVTKWQD